MVAAKTCIKCGSEERNSNGDCRPCQIACSAAWKAKRKARLAASDAPAFYTYIHRRADDGKVFYVGKGKGERASSYGARSQYWHRTERKHGIRIEIVSRWASEAEAFNNERMLIAGYRDIGHPLCNHTDGGDGPSGFKHSAATRAKISAIQIGKVISAEHREKLSIAGLGRIQSTETRLKISASNTGRKRTAEQNRRNSEARIGKPISARTLAALVAANTGRPRSAETRAKIAAGHIGKTNSAEARAKISAANRGRVRSAEFRAKVSAGLMGRPVSEATRAKMSAAHKGRIISQEMRAKISETLSGRRLSEAEKERLRPLTHSAERCARHSAAMNGRPWSDARRAAQKGGGRASGVA